MSTTVKFKVDGINDEMEAVGLSFGYASYANVSNPTTDIDFSPIQVSEFVFGIMEPKKETITALIKWITTHEIKGTATFEIRKQGASESPRKLELKQACLTSYNESIQSGGTNISLSVIGQVVTVDDVEVDQTTER
jgi:hypothetical protein